jgi:hypothetical protein
MFDHAALLAVAAHRMSEAHEAADRHRQRVTLRRDPRSVLATRLQRLAVRLDRRVCAPTQAHTRAGGPIATDRELCRAA